MHSHYGLDKVFAEMPKEKLFYHLKFRLNFLEEELAEAWKAFDEYNGDDMVDACTDLIVVALGTLDAFGVDAQVAWDRVLKANMSKIAGQNPSRPNNFNLPDLRKPDDFIAPTHADNVGRLQEAFDEVT
jgi:predicted HAD superfamily Cof-like phosphohydrolase